jgi:hypothetical protein
VFESCLRYLCLSSFGVVLPCVGRHVRWADLLSKESYCMLKDKVSKPQQRQHRFSKNCRARRALGGEVTLFNWAYVVKHVPS